MQGDACSCVTFDQHCILIQETEASILWILHAPSSLGSLPLCARLAKRVLLGINSLFCLLHRPILQLVQVSGLLTCRGLLSSFLQDFMPVFESNATESWCSMHDMFAPMSPHRGLPFTTIAGETFRGARSQIRSCAMVVRTPRSCHRPRMAFPHRSPGTRNHSPTRRCRL
jgi:hypothetical protein